MNVKYIVILVICLLLVIIFKYVEPLISKHKIKKNSEYGSARFSNKVEIKENFKKESIKHINRVGFPILFDNKLSTVWMDNETPHWVYLGSTGSGKSVTQVIPFCSFLSSAEEKRSVFITDPKGEIFSTTSKMFKDRGYEVITIDFRNPEKSNKYNILEPIINEYEKYIEYEKKSLNSKTENDKIINSNKSMSHYAETNRLISSLSDMIMKDKFESKDPFWLNSSRQLLEGIIGFFLEEYKLGNLKRNQITMTSIRKFQNSSMNPINFEKFKAYLNTKKYGSKSKDSLTSIITASENTYRSVTSVWGSKMSIFDDVNVANVTSESDFDLSQLGKKPTALYVIVPDEDKTYFTLVTIMVGLLYRELVKVANNEENKKLPVQIDWLLDEFANCPPLSDIEAIVSVARSRGMRFHFFIQSFAQLDNVYGKEVAQIILDNCGLVYLKTNTQDTAESISKRLGKQTIESNSISQSLSLNKYDGNQSTSLIARDLLTPDEIKQLHYKMIIFPIVGYPIIRDTILYNKFSCYVKGAIERKINNLIDLSNTYFTVENIKYDLKKALFNKEELSKEDIEMIDEKEEMEKQCFKEIEQKLLSIYDGMFYSLEYKQSEGAVTYLYFESENELPPQYMLSLQNEYIDFHFNIYKNNNKQVIEVHFKSIVQMFNNI